MNIFNWLVLLMLLILPSCTTNEPTNTEGAGVSSQEGGGWRGTDPKTIGPKKGIRELEPEPTPVQIEPEEEDDGDDSEEERIEKIEPRIPKKFSAQLPPPPPKRVAISEPEPQQIQIPKENSRAQLEADRLRQMQLEQQERVAAEKIQKELEIQQAEHKAQLEKTEKERLEQEKQWEEEKRQREEAERKRMKKRAAEIQRQQEEYTLQQQQEREKKDANIKAWTERDRIRAEKEQQKQEFWTAKAADATTLFEHDNVANKPTLPAKNGSLKHIDSVLDIKVKDLNNSIASGHAYIRLPKDNPLMKKQIQLPPEVKPAKLYMLDKQLMPVVSDAQGEVFGLEKSPLEPLEQVSAEESSYYQNAITLTDSKSPLILLEKRGYTYEYTNDEVTLHAVRIMKDRITNKDFGADVAQLLERLYYTGLVPKYYGLAPAFDSTLIFTEQIYGNLDSGSAKKKVTDEQLLGVARDFPKLFKAAEQIGLVPNIIASQNLLVVADDKIVLDSKVFVKKEDLKESPVAATKQLFKTLVEIRMPDFDSPDKKKFHKYAAQTAAKAYNPNLDVRGISNPSDLANDIKLSIITDRILGSWDQKNNDVELRVFIAQKCLVKNINYNEFQKAVSDAFDALIASNKTKEYFADYKTKVTSPRSFKDFMDEKCPLIVDEILKDALEKKYREKRDELTNFAFDDGYPDDTELRRELIKLRDSK